MKTVAIIGPTASGKSELAIECAKKCGAVILSLDSLSVYKEIDIASAKPSKEERDEVLHFGIDLIYPNENFSVAHFLKEYEKAREYAKKNGKNLLITGGSSFYLKTLIDGISPLPKLSHQTVEKVKRVMADKSEAYRLLESIDKEFANNIEPGDSYRIEKGLCIYFQTDLPPTQYFKKHPKRAILKDVEIFEIYVDRDLLRKRIESRTDKMLKTGLIDEVAALEKKFGRSYPSMKAIGIAETLAFLDGKLDLNGLYEKIVTNTYRLAKRQQTFNKTQFKEIIRGKREELLHLLPTRLSN